MAASAVSRTHLKYSLFAGAVVKADSESEVCSYDSLKNRFALTSTDNCSWHYAVDVELKADPLPEFIAAALSGDAIQRWGDIEVVAKLSNVPSHLVLREFVLGRFVELVVEYGIELMRMDTESHWVVVGRRARRKPSPYPQIIR